MDLVRMMEIHFGNENVMHHTYAIRGNPRRKSVSCRRRPAQDVVSDIINQSKQGNTCQKKKVYIFRNKLPELHVKHKGMATRTKKGRMDRSDGCCGKQKALARLALLTPPPLLSSPLQPLLSSAQSLCLAFSRCIQVPTLIFPLLSYKSDTRHSDPDLALTASKSHLVGPPIPTARASASGSSRHSKATLILPCYHLNLTATQALDFLALFFSVLLFSFRQ